MILNCLFAGIGGFFGTVLRYLASFIPVQQNKSSIPYITLFINIIGSFLIGFIASSIQKIDPQSKILLFLKVGFCGGFTTFSTFAFEFTSLAEKGSFLVAGIYVVLSIAGGFIAVLCGTKLATLLF